MEIVKRSVIASSWGKGGMARQRAQKIFRVIKLSCIIVKWWVHVIM